MSNETEQVAAGKLSNGIRVAFGVSGIVAVVLGVLILIAPMKTASIVSAIIAIYALVSGIVYAAIALFSKKLGTWKRAGYGVLGALFLLVGVIALTDLGNTTTVIATLVAIVIGVAWIAEGIVAVVSLRSASNKLWVAIYAAVSIIAGVIVLFAPFAFAALLWIVLGISLIVLGIVQILRGFSFNASEVLAGA